MLTVDIGHYEDLNREEVTRVSTCAVNGWPMSIVICKSWNYNLYFWVTNSKNNLKDNSMHLNKNLDRIYIIKYLIRST